MNRQMKINILKVGIGRWYCFKTGCQRCSPRRSTLEINCPQADWSEADCVVDVVMGDFYSDRLLFVKIVFILFRFMSKNDTSCLIESSNDVFTETEKIPRWIRGARGWECRWPCLIFLVVSAQRTAGQIDAFLAIDHARLFCYSRVDRRRKRRIDIENCLFLEKEMRKGKVRRNERISSFLSRFSPSQVIELPHIRVSIDFLIGHG